MVKREFNIQISSNRILYGDFRVPQDKSNDKLIIFCHGFKGFKNWGGWQYAMDKFCSNGFFVISMNFTGNGVGDDFENFTELDKFAENTIGKEIEDIGYLIDHIINSKEFPELESDFDRPTIGLIGHSRGGPTVILKADTDERIDSIVTWAGMSIWDRYTDQREVWRDTGHIEFLNGRTKQMMKMNLSFLEDLENNMIARDVLLAEKNLKIPHLILHGDEDEAVKIEDGMLLYNSSNKETTELNIIRGAGHTFGQTHPFENTTPHLEEVIAKTTTWFKDKL